MSELTILEGDAIARMRELPAESVHLICTSPPYFGLRDYKIPPSVWPDGWKGCFGLEPSMAMYVEHSVLIFREAKRVLRKDGVMFLNLGDSFSSGDRHALVYDTSGKGLEDSKDRDCLSENLCDECREVLCRKVRSDGSLDSKPAPLLSSPSRVRRAKRSDHLPTLDSSVPVVRNSISIEGQAIGGVRGVGPSLASEESKPFESCLRHRASCLHCANCEACLSVLHSSSRDARLCARKMACTCDNAQSFSFSENRKSKDCSGDDVLDSGQYLTESQFLKQGDMMGLPWRVALALQADGWYLRRDNIWAKKNPMPESVSGWRWEKHRIKTKVGQTKDKHPSRLGGSDKSRSHVFGTHNGEKAFEHAAEYIDCPGCAKCSPHDGLVLRKGNWRCTTSHEYVFQFSKSSSYFCDAEAARERTSGTAHHRGAGVNPKAVGRNSRFRVSRSAVAEKKESDIRHKQNRSFSAAVRGVVANRNMRSVWSIPTRAYRGAHFATFPPDLVRPIIKAASPVRCCGACGAPHAPIVERGEPLYAQQRACGGDLNGFYDGQATKDFGSHGAQNASAVKARILAGMVEKKVIGYAPTCGCKYAPAASAVVLDMFAGSGTVGQVSLELGRSVVLIEISSKYIPLIKERCGSVTGPLNL